MLTANLFSMYRFSTSKSKPFKLIRVYKELSNLELLNALMVNRTSNNKWIVANAMKMYNFSCSVLSQKFTNWIIRSTFGRVFTAGETSSDVTDMMNLFQRMKIPVIIDFAGEGFIDKRAVESELDKNAEMFKKTGEVASQYPNQMISIKISAMVDVQTLRKLDDTRMELFSIWKTYSQNDKITGKGLLKAFQKINGAVTQQDVEVFIKQIFGQKFQSSLEKFECDRVDFLMHVHPYYCIEQQKNKNKLIQLLTSLSQDDQTRIQNLVRRLDSIFKTFQNDNFRITVDAEQSYLQQAINSISQQYQAKYNTKNAYIIPTLQNYLKNAIPRMDYEVQIAHRKGVCFGMKHVRGAYIVQQNRIAQQRKYESPIVCSYEQTTQNYNRNTNLGLTSPKILPNSEMIIATHNQQTIEVVQGMMKQKNNSTKLYFAQLQGLADHLTIQLNKQGYDVYKYLPYGATQTMVPYLIRRSQQLSQMRYPLTLQYELIVDEFRNRIGLNS